MGLVVRADELRPGDRIVLPMVGSRRIISAEPGTVGLTGRPCVDVVYSTGVGGGGSYENRGGQHGPSRFPQTEGGVKPLRPDEPVTIEPRGAAA